MDKDGIYMPDGSFRSREQIISDAYISGEVVQKTPLNEAFNFERWQQIAQRRRDERLEFEGYPSEVEIEIPTQTPICIAFMGDNHIGGLYHDYEMMGLHTNLVAEHPLMYAALQGDLIDGFFFNPAQDGQVESFKEQEAHAIAMLERMNGSLLYATVGDHDAWAERVGAGFYSSFVRKYGIHLLRGSSIVRLKIGEVDYTIVTAHQLPGHSMYTNTHPEKREARFGMQGADLYVAGHTHRKGVDTHHQKDIDGGRRQLFVSVGPYKYADDYAMKKGYSQQNEHERGAVWVEFNPYRREMTPYWSSQEAVDHMGKYLD